MMGPLILGDEEMTYFFFASLLSGARGVAGTPPVRPVLLECPVTVSVGLLSPRL